MRVVGGAGITGYYSCSQVTLIDTIGLGDPLLARLPVPPHQRDPAVHRGWRIGHCARTVPPGYVKARETGSTEGMDPALIEFWKVLRLITTGPVWGGERLRAVIEFNLGHYDEIRDDYVARCIDEGQC